jgi:Zn-dependent protease
MLTNARGGGFRLFRVAGINVYLHWSWLLVATYEVSRRSGYSSPVWNLLEYLSLFLIVLLHEFGHALACRSVGGTADQIMLWPLGGVAYVRPPQRPGAVLWSIVAGPLVNVLLLPATWGSYYLIPAQGDLRHFLFALAFINTGLLIFNLLPIYPLDGGKILWALLWFIIGQARALMVASAIGLVGTIGCVLAIIAIAGMKGIDIWLLLIAAFAVTQSLAGLKQARALSHVLSLPRNTSCLCPSCRQSPPLGVGWRCQQCNHVYDLFAESVTCPQCGLRVDPVPCPLCGTERPWNDWICPAAPPPAYQRVPVAPFPPRA